MPPPKAPDAIADLLEPMLRVLAHTLGRVAREDSILITDEALLLMCKSMSGAAVAGAHLALKHRADLLENDEVREWVEKESHPPAKVSRQKTVAEIQVEAVEIGRLKAALENAELALKKACHALTWSSPEGGESCNGPVSEDQAAQWREEADEAIDLALEGIQKAVRPPGE